MAGTSDPLGGKLVYTTATGRIRGEQTAEAKSKTKNKRKAKAPQPPSTGVARVRREKKGRGGKEVTVIWDLPERGAQLKTLGQTLRKACGTGGTVKKGGTIELQGDQIAAVVAHFAAHDRELLRSGG